LLAFKTSVPSVIKLRGTAAVGGGGVSGGGEGGSGGSSAGMIAVQLTETEILNSKLSMSYLLFLHVWQVQRTGV